MIRWHRTTLLSALAVGLMAATPKAQAAEPPGPADDAKPPAEGAGEEGEAAADDKPPPPPPPDLGGWGVGGKDEEGQFGPKGKTGKLKELEEEKGAEGGDLPPELPPPGYVYLDTVIGFGDTMVVAQPSGATDVTATASFLIGAGYRIGDTWSIGARFPISTGASNGPLDPYFPDARDPDAYKQIATGGVELEVKPWFILSHTLRLPAGLAFVLPSGMGDYSPDPDNRAAIGQAIVNQAASGSRGWEERALFAHKRFSIVPSIGIAFRDAEVEFNAGTKLEIMIRTGGNDPEETAKLDRTGAAAGALQQRVRSVILNWWTGAEFFYHFADGLFAPGARLWLAAGSAGDYRENTGDEKIDGYNGLIPVGEADYGGAQFAFEPQIRTSVPFVEDKSIGLDARLGYVLPLGMRLGGADDTFISGLRIRTGMFF